MAVQELKGAKGVESKDWVIGSKLSKEEMWILQGCPQGMAGFAEGRGMMQRKPGEWV